MLSIQESLCLQWLCGPGPVVGSVLMYRPTCASDAVSQKDYFGWKCRKKGKRMKLQGTRSETTGGTRLKLDGGTVKKKKLREG